MKLTNKQKRGVKRQVDLEQGVRPPGSSVFVNKKKYNNLADAARIDYERQDVNSVIVNVNGHNYKVI